MAIFDQRSQQVVYQYNIVGDINFGSVQNKADVAPELQKLKLEVRKARDAGAIDEDTATDVVYDIEKAVNQAKKEGADKNSAIGYLEKVIFVFHPGYSSEHRRVVDTNLHGSHHGIVLRSEDMILLCDAQNRIEKLEDLIMN
ncbi:MAG TPA: hypothetical protein VFV58_07035 [Blastocatellia bacterium]|jgi:hypothetical protein|nr:hypothetical protein [Blastocatellia bacterium]